MGRGSSGKARGKQDSFESFIQQGSKKLTDNERELLDAQRKAYAEADTDLVQEALGIHSEDADHMFLAAQRLLEVDSQGKQSAYYKKYQREAAFHQALHDIARDELDRRKNQEAERQAQAERWQALQRRQETERKATNSFMRSNSAFKMAGAPSTINVGGETLQYFGESSTTKGNTKTRVISYVGTSQNSYGEYTQFQVTLNETTRKNKRVGGKVTTTSYAKRGTGYQ